MSSPPPSPPTPTPEQYQRIREIFHGVWLRPPGERTAFLESACAGDAALRGEVESLLAAATVDPLFMGKPAFEGACPGGERPPMPETIGRYRIVRLLGEGGMGSAYEARQENPARHVAVKTIRPGLGTPMMVRRFANEAQILGRLRHPGIAQVYEAGLADTPTGPMPFIAMELIAGVTLDRWVSGRGPTRRARIEIVARICDAVQHAHGNGVIHRDLKPGNILVEDGEASPPGEAGDAPTRIAADAHPTIAASATTHHERASPTEPPAPSVSRSSASLVVAAMPKVLDFGVARLLDPVPGGTPHGTLVTEPGTLVGTLAYMSPEQVAGDSTRIDARTDVFSLGVILFELLTGTLPRDTDGKPPAEAARIIHDEEPARAASLDRSLRGDLDIICAKALEREPARRYQTAAEFATDLRRHLDDEPIIARPATVMYQARKFAKRHRGLVAGLAAAGVVLILGVASTVWYAVVAGRERGHARAQEAAAQWTSYRLTIAAAEEGVRTNPGRTRAQLAAVPEDQRRWEWRHFMARLESGGVEVVGDEGVSAGASFTPDGEARAATVRGGLAVVSDLATGMEQGSFPVPPGITATMLSADARMLVAFGARSGAIIVCDIENGTRRPIDAFLGQEVLALGISPDRSLLGVVVKRLGVFVLDAATGARLRAYEFSAISAGYRVVEFSPDNTRLLCSAVNEESTWVHMYNAADPMQTRTVDQATVAIFDASASRIASAAIGGVRLRGGESLALLGTIHGQFRDVYALAFSGDGSRLAGFVGKETINVWNPATGVLERAITAPKGTLHIALDAPGERVLAAAEHRVTLLPLTDQGVVVLRGHTSYVYSVAWSPNGHRIASAGWDGSVRVWDAATGDPRAELPVQPTMPLAPIAAIAFAADSGDLLAMSHTGTLLRFDGESLVLKDQTTPIGDAATRTPIVERFWRGACPGAKRVYQTGGERDSSSPRGDLLARVEDRLFVGVSRREDGKEVLRFKAHDSNVLATAFSPDGRRLVTGSEDRIIRIWDPLSGRRLAELTEHQSPIYTINFSPDGSRMVSGDGDGLIFVWDTARNEKVAELRGHTSYVHSLAFSPDGETLCSGSGDGTVRLWRTVP